MDQTSMELLLLLSMYKYSKKRNEGNMRTTKNKKWFLIPRQFYVNTVLRCSIMAPCDYSIVSFHPLET